MLLMLGIVDGGIVNVCAIDACIINDTNINNAIDSNDTNINNAIDSNDSIICIVIIANVCIINVDIGIAGVGI